ncbi:hypothetical protein EPUL_000066 [Erysiphe pulchra]|uniref:Uncharacterized protein n=1 Tax=Erysiphe pulchra TaxID=225359 RepID=A0A2S4Q1R2_9PEZI|nr:hypothetical protein EPUL_000066 [Erysiphe pulchra]
MNFRVPESSDSLSDSNFFYSLPRSEISNHNEDHIIDFCQPSDQNPYINSTLVMLPINLWSLPHITHTPEILSEAIKIKPELVSRLSTSNTPSKPEQKPHASSSNPPPSYNLAYCLGPGALVKMGSSFRCLEDPSVPAEITSLQEFLDALKQGCQDPGLEEKATRAVEILYRKKTPFYESITLFEDYMADSTYANQEKSHWKIMLQ